MKRWLIIFLGSISLCLLYGLRVQQVVADGIYILSMQDGSRFFHTNDLSCVQKGNIDAAFEQPVAAQVSNGFRVEDISVSAVNENFAHFTQMQVWKGAFFNEMQVSRRYKLAVLNENAAYRLFGSEDCVGQAVFLNNVSYKVVGIMREQVEEAEAKIYIPYTVLEDMDAELSVGQLWCRFENLAEAASVLNQMGYSLKDVYILQTNNLKGIFMQRFWILVVLINVHFLTYLMSGFLSKKTPDKIRGKKEWHKRRFLFSLGLLPGAVLGIGITFKALRMAAYIPPAYEMSKESWRTVVCKLFDFYLLTDINICYLPCLRYWNMFSLSAFVICLVSGTAVSFSFFHHKK